MKTFSDFLIEMKSTKSLERDFFQTFKLNFDQIISNTEPEDVLTAISENNIQPDLNNPDLRSSMTCQEIPSFTRQDFLGLIYVGSLFSYKRYNELYDFLEKVNFEVGKRCLDFFNSKLIRYYYLACKFKNAVRIEELFSLKARNSEYGNPYSTAVLTNCILDYQINKSIYILPQVELKKNLDGIIDSNVVFTDDYEEAARYSFYNGIIHLVLGNYSKSILFFDEADILNKNRVMELKIRKYTIVAKLLISEYSISYPYRDDFIPYFSLIGAVKRGELDNFKSILETYKDLFISENLYAVISRLMTNVLKEGIRRVSICYSRIKIEDIGKILGINNSEINVEFLLQKTISESLLSGKIENGIFVSEEKKVEKVDLGSKINRIISVRNSLKKLMEYSEVKSSTSESSQVTSE